MKTMLIITLLGLLCVNICDAQNIRISTGTIISNFDYSEKDKEIFQNSIASPFIGIDYEEYLSDYFYLTIGAFGGKTSTYVIESMQRYKKSLYGAVVPIKIGINIPYEGIGILLSGGYCGGYIFKGEDEYKSYTYKIKFGSKNNQYNHFVHGLTIGGGFELGRINLELAYFKVLGNLIQTATPSVTLKPNLLKLCFTYKLN